MADVHCRLDGRDEVRRLLDGVAEQADAVVLAGDLTDTGRPAEMEILLSVVAEIPLPFVAVLGNHDHETDHHERLMEMMEAAGVTVLDASVHEIEDVGFVGTKGFCGGFEERIVQPFGEDALKQLIQTGGEAGRVQGDRGRPSLRARAGHARGRAPRALSLARHVPARERAGSPRG
jgi:hypothetical protein